MLTRTAKSLFYYCAGPLMRLNGAIYRHLRAPVDGNIRVHLGPGQNNYMDGWINVDANMFTGKCDVWADLRNSLPFKDDTVDAFYSHHMVEHLPNISVHMEQIYRCLKPRGVYRLGGPNGESAIKKYLEGDSAWFGDFPDRRRSIGGRLENFIFCRQEHLTILTFSFVEELLEDAGFTQITQHLAATGTAFPDVFEPCLAFESELDPDFSRTLIVEAVKPAV